MKKIWTRLQRVVLLLKATSLNIKVVGASNRDTKTGLCTFLRATVQNENSLLSRGWRNCLVLRVPAGSAASLWGEKPSRRRHWERRKPPDCRRQSDLWSDRCPLRCPEPSTPAGTCVAGARQKRIIADVQERENFDARRRPCALKCGGISQRPPMANLIRELLNFKIQFENAHNGKIQKIFRSSQTGYLIEILNSCCALHKNLDSSSFGW